MTATEDVRDVGSPRPPDCASTADRSGCSTFPRSTTPAAATTAARIRSSCCTASRRARSTGDYVLDALRARPARRRGRLPRLRPFRQARRPLQHAAPGRCRRRRGARSSGSRRSRCSRTTWATPSAASCWRAASRERCRSRSRRRVLTNGSIYIEMAHLTNGQQLLLSLDDAATDLVVADGFKAGLAGTFSPNSNVADDELEAQWLFAERNGGNRLLPRTIRYIEDRRAEERRFTGAIETHPSPLARRVGRRRPDRGPRHDRRATPRPPRCRHHDPRRRRPLPDDRIPRPLRRRPHPIPLTPCHQMAAKMLP